MRPSCFPPVGRWRALTKAYSLDLRERVVRFVEADHSCHAAARHFTVSVAFVVKLIAAFRRTGSFAPKPEGGWRYSKLDPHRDFLLRRVAETSDLMMPELAAELASLGTRVTPASISRWFMPRSASASRKGSSGACLWPQLDRCRCSGRSGSSRYSRT